MDHQPERGRINALVIGNIKIYLLNPSGLKTLPARNGMVGGCLPEHLEPSTYPMARTSLIVIHSDGVSESGTRQTLQELDIRAAQQQLEAQLLSQQIVDQHGKWSDDASCAVVLNKNGVQP